MSPEERLNETARQVNARLAQTFGVSAPAMPSCDSPWPVGLEIEVPWRSYFPDLWHQFGLDRRRFGTLEPAEIHALTTACAELESTLLPRLRQTVACGVPRGNDRYWEFALAPVHDVAEAWRTIELLTAAGLLPRDRGHSLQITLGNVPACRDVYYLAFGLEVLTTEPARVQQGLAQAQHIVHTGWARKGEAGVLQKNADELQLGSRVACELRLLQLPTDAETTARVLQTVAWGARAIAERRAGRITHTTQQWDAWCARGRSALLVLGLPDRRWRTRGADRALWTKWADHLSWLREIWWGRVPWEEEWTEPGQSGTGHCPAI